MKAEEQVCGVEQAKKLKKFGIKQDGYFCWNHYKKELWTYEDEPPVALIKSLGLYGMYSNHEYYSAYTVGELGLMLPQRSAIDKAPATEEIVNMLFEDQWWQWKADRVAMLLIHLLETNQITPEQVSQKIQ